MQWVTFMKYIIEMAENEYWWGGTTVDGRICPFDRETVLKRNFYELCPNQTMPMYLSNMGRCIWSDKPFAVKIENGRFEIDGEDVVVEQFGDTLRSAYCGAMEKALCICYAEAYGIS